MTEPPETEYMVTFTVRTSGGSAQDAAIQAQRKVTAGTGRVQVLVWSIPTDLDQEVQRTEIDWQTLEAGDETV